MGAAEVTTRETRAPGRRLRSRVPSVGLIAARSLPSTGGRRLVLRLEYTGQESDQRPCVFDKQRPAAAGDPDGMVGGPYGVA